MQLIKCYNRFTAVEKQGYSTLLLRPCGSWWRCCHQEQAATLRLHNPIFPPHQGSSNHNWEPRVPPAPFLPTSSPFQPKPRAQSPTPSFEPHAWHRRASIGPLQTEQRGKNDTTKPKTLLVFQFMKCHMCLPLTWKSHWICQNILRLKPHPRTEYVAHILMWS